MGVTRISFLSLEKERALSLKAQLLLRSLLHCMHCLQSFPVSLKQLQWKKLGKNSQANPPCYHFHFAPKKNKATPRAALEPL